MPPHFVLTSVISRHQIAAVLEPESPVTSELISEMPSQELTAAKKFILEHVPEQGTTFVKILQAAKDEGHLEDAMRSAFWSLVADHELKVTSNFEVERPMTPA